jgi:O-antigen/teichoic acid export membrane protein
MKLAILDAYKNNLVINRLAKVFSVDVLVKASGFLLLPVYLRLMSQQEYGLYSYLISIVNTFALLLNFGLYIAQSKIYQDLPTIEHKGRFIYTLQLLLMVLLVPTLILVYSFKLDYSLFSILFNTPIDYKGYRFFILLAVVVSIYSFMLSNFFLTSEKIRHIQKYNFIRLIAINVLSIAMLSLLHNDAVKTRFFYTYSVEFVLAVVFYYFYIKDMRRGFERPLALKAMRLGFPIMAVSVCDLVINFGDKFFIEKYVGISSLSIYYLAFSAASILPFFFSTLQNVWLPIFLKEKDLDENIRKTKKMMKQVALIFLLLSVGILVVMKACLLLHLIDKKYNDAMLLLPIVLLSQSISAITHLIINYMVYFEKTYLSSVVSASLGCMSIVLNFLFIRPYGIYGAAFSLLAINVVQIIVYYLIVRANVRRVKSEGNKTLITG